MPDGDLEFPEPPKGETQEYRRLVAAHDTYLRGVAGIVIPAASPSGSIGRWVPYALYHHLIQLGRALHDLVVLGYSDEALPIGRAMLSASVYGIFLITSDNPDGWALRYWFQWRTRSSECFGASSESPVLIPIGLPGSLREPRTIAMG